MKEHVKKLYDLVRYLAQVEGTTTAGRVNMLGMLLSVILAISLSLGSIFETLVRLIHPNVVIGAPLVQIFVIFCVFTLICTGMLAYLEGPRQVREKSKADEEDASSGGSPEPEQASVLPVPAVTSPQAPRTAGHVSGTMVKKLAITASALIRRRAPAAGGSGSQGSSQPAERRGWPGN